MQCQSLQLPNQTRAIICSGRRTSRRQVNPQCACGEASDYLCDFPDRRAQGTCSAAICVKCSLHLPTGDDSLDYCATHSPFVFQFEGRRILVVNNRNTQSGELIDRTTPLGNPYTLGEMTDTPGARLTIIAKYRKFLWKQMQIANSPVNLELARLLQIWQESGELILRCWCAPKHCHGQVIAKALMHLLKEKNADWQGSPRAQGG